MLSIEGLQAIILAGMFVCAAKSIEHGGNLKSNSNVVSVLSFILYVCATIVLLIASFYGKF